MKYHFNTILFLIFIQLSFGQNNISYKIIYKQKYLKTSSNKEKKESFKNFENRILKDINNLKFSLEFNRTKYSFKRIKKMELDTRGIKLALSLGSGKGVYYGDIEKNIRLHKKNSFGSDFIIKSSFNELKWDIQNETKIIGGYKCRKATLYEDIYTSKGKKKRLVVAWFTTQIPSNFGPAGYGNLPGLIIELNKSGKYVFYVDKIIISKSEIKLNPPKNGKVLTMSEFNLLSKKIQKDRNKRN